MVSSLRVYNLSTFLETGMRAKRFAFLMLFRWFSSMCHKCHSCVFPQHLFVPTYDELGQHLKWFKYLKICPTQCT